MTRRSKILLIAILILVGIWLAFRFGMGKKGRVRPPKTPSIEMAQSGSAMQQAVQDVLASYLLATSAAAKADTALLKAHITQFRAKLSAVPLSEMGADSLPQVQTARTNFADIDANANSLLMQTSIGEMRRDLNMMAQMMFPTFFQTTQYRGTPIYVFDCAGAFGPDTQAYWFDTKRSTANPYGNASCIELKDSIAGN